MTPLVASDLRLERTGTAVRLSCAVADPDGALPERLWYEIDECVAGLLRPTADGFLPVLLTAAMARRRPLHVDGSVAAEHVAGALRVAEDGLAPARLTVAHVRDEDPRGAGAGAFFSAGVGSIYTLLANRARYPMGDARRISHLVVLHGYDLALEERALFARLLRECDEVGARVAALPVWVRTNARAALAGLDWSGYGFGAVLAGTALALAPGLHTMYVPSGGRPFVETAQIDLSIHPEIAGWWSTRAHELVFDPPHVPRRDKVRALVGARWPLPYLRVCGENRGGAYNCGECEKCARTQVELALAGAADVGAFAAPLSLPRLRALRFDPRARAYWEELRAEAAAGPEHAAVARALDEMLAARAWAASRAGRVDAWLSALAARTGLGPARLKALDARLLRGRGGAAYRRAQRMLASRRRGHRAPAGMPPPATLSPPATRPQGGLVGGSG